MPPLKQIVGQRFGALVVDEATAARSRGNAVWRCRCDCGNSVDVSYRDLVKPRANTLSCGCISSKIRELSTYHRTHGRSSTRLFEVWMGMWGRCSNPNNVKYPRYGGRGITVCDRWAQFENFAIDMGEPPAGLTLDRKDVNGHYEPLNCRWATSTTQRRNRDDVKLELHEPSQIRWLLDAYPAREVAKFFVLNQATVYRIRDRRIYGDIP